MKNILKKNLIENIRVYLQQGFYLEQQVLKFYPARMQKSIYTLHCGCSSGKGMCDENGFQYSGKCGRYLC